MDDDRESRYGKVARVAPWAAAVVSLVAVATVIVVQLCNQDGRADTTTLGLLLIGVILLFGIAAPVEAVKAAKRITKLRVGALELGLEVIKLAERVQPVPGENDKIAPVRPPDCDYAQIAVKLQGRLRFVRKILELREVTSKLDYVGIISWLRENGLLRQEEEAFALDLLDGPRADLAEWDAPIRKNFLDAAYAFSARFGPKIWDRWVRRELTTAGWFVAGFDQGKKHRADFLAYRTGSWAQMTARVGGGKSGYIERAAPRLLRFEPPELIKSSVIVIPKIRYGKVKEEYAWGPAHPDGVRVLNLQELIEDPSLPFEKPSPT